MQRIGSDVAIFLDADRRPIAERDFAEVAAAGGADAAAFLLATIDPVGELVIRDDVIELRRRLVVPGTPGLAAVHADGRTLIDGQRDDVWVIGIDPDGVVIVAARCAFNGGEVLAGVIGLVGRSVGNIDDILVLWIDAHHCKVVASSPHAFFGVHQLPAFAGIVGAVDAALLLRVH